MTSENLLEIEGMKVHQAHVEQWMAHQARNELNDMLYHQAHIEEQENDIALMASVFSDNTVFMSFDEWEAWNAQNEINSTKQKIKVLKEELRKQEAIINCSEAIVKNFKKTARAEKTHNRSRPKRSEFKERVARKFTVQWVESLKNVLGVKSCGKLAGLISLPMEVSLTGQRNWRRWLNGDAIPTYTTFEKLLSAKILEGNFVGSTIYDLPLSPSSNSLLTLLRFL